MAPPTTTDTRERILGAAADLFAHKGYSGTRTREISDAVGIRQPSLFHHFASKAEIAEALLEHSLAGVVAPIRALAERDQPASTRLYGYVYSDTIFLATSPYDMRGLQVGDIIETRSSRAGPTNSRSSATASPRSCDRASNAASSSAWTRSSPARRSRGCTR